MAQKSSVFLLRHCESVYNAQGKSELNCGLTEKGQDQAKKIEGAGFDVIICSPLHRARQTLFLSSISLSHPSLLVESWLCREFRIHSSDFFPFEKHLYLKTLESPLDDDDEEEDQEGADSQEEVKEKHDNLQIEKEKEEEQKKSFDNPRHREERQSEWTKRKINRHEDCTIIQLTECGRESEESILSRTSLFREYLKENHLKKGERVLVVGHADFFFYFTSYIHQNERFGKWLENGEMLEFSFAD